MEKLTEGTTVTKSGLAYKVINKGSGKTHPTAENTVTVHYTGKLTDGTVFDSSVDRGEPATFPLNKVIPGWTEGVQLMVVGDKIMMITKELMVVDVIIQGHDRLYYKQQLS